MATVRTYTVPLRKEWLKVPKYKRAKKAVTALKQFLVKHMKSENVKLGKYVNQETKGDQTPWLSRKELFGDLPLALVE